jgi:co-chaperonin GroES (HSP10)
MKPTRNGVLINKIAEENVTDSGVILLSEKRTNPIAMVIEVGSRVKKHGVLKQGDTVVFQKGTDITVVSDEAEFNLVNYDNIIAIK